MAKKVKARTKTEKYHIHTTVSKHDEDLLKKYAAFKDENNQELFGNQSKVIERALQLLDNYYNPKKNDINTIWSRARDELNMVLVGKTTFLCYIKGKQQDAYRYNIAVEIIEWYLGKRIDQIDIEEFLNGLIGVWHMANYFYKIEMEKTEKGAFQIRFNHDLTRSYSEYWAGYFETLLKKHWKCEVDYSIRNESFYLIIKEL